MRIRKGQLGDADTLAAFNQAMARETENLTLDEEVVRQGVSRFLANDRYGFYVVVEVHGVVIASLMITYEWSDWRNGVFWWIQSVFVEPEHRRGGVYTALYRHVESLAKQAGEVRGFRLYVEKNNRIARRTYAKLGMQETYYRLYETLYPIGPAGPCDDDPHATTGKTIQ